MSNVCTTFDGKHFKHQRKRQKIWNGSKKTDLRYAPLQNAIENRGQVESSSEHLIIDI